VTAYSSTSLRLLALGLTSAAVIWTAAILCTPRQNTRARFPVVAALVRTSGAVICHQRPERSFHGDGGQFPVCARCTGLYLSGALGALIGWGGLSRVPRRMRLTLALAAAPTLLTIAAEWSGAAAISNAIRAAAAVPLGGTVGWVLVRMLRAESEPGACAMII
jgi:uncharacterized membrane protein